ncbi:hypothetical protein ACFO4O_16625 [Glaciecola siphonariae]|uniref:FAS1 domain-containing protein n=1 Tax=Glaciecola siphonariae TaxID=521012 RepID=A0ABV9M251_9ALTE
MPQNVARTFLRYHIVPFAKPKGGDWSSLDGLGARLASTDDHMATCRGFTERDKLHQGCLLVQIKSRLIQIKLVHI